jgi:hypothetical protein
MKSRVVQAMWSSLCLRCGQGVNVGDPVVPDGEFGWVHEDCEEPEFTEPRSSGRSGEEVDPAVGMSRDEARAAMCQRCYLIHAGECP